MLTHPGLQCLLVDRLPVGCSTASGYLSLWAINDGLNWVYDALDDPTRLYLRCVVLSAGVFFGLSAARIAAKWLQHGSFRPLENIPRSGLAVLSLLGRQDAGPLGAGGAVRGSPLYSLYLRLLGARQQ